MFLIKRFLVLLLAVSLVPFSPAHPAKADDSQPWTGTFTQVLDRYWHATIDPPRVDLAPTSVDQRWIYRREIRLLGDGTAIQTTTFTESLIISQYNLGSITGDCKGTYTGNYMGSSIETISPVEVYLDASQVAVSYPQIPLTAYRSSQWDDCWTSAGIADFYLPNPSKVVLEYPRQWFHNGFFAADELVIGGRDVWFEQTWDNQTPTSRDIQTKFTSYSLSREKDNTWLPKWVKDSLKIKSKAMQYGGFVVSAGEVVCVFAVTCPEIGVPIVIIGAGMEAEGFIDGKLATDPIDPNYTEIANPVTPVLNQQPILAGVAITQAQADAINALLTNIEQDIGLGLAILTAFNRASGAQAANDSIWVANQLQAARTYAGQLANILDARPSLLVALKQALQTFPGFPLILTGEDMAKYKYNLATLGFSASQNQIFTDLGLDDRGKTEVLDAMLLTDFPAGLLPSDEVSRFPDVLTDPDQITSIHNLANTLREFSLGSGWKTFMPLVGR